MVGPFFSCEYLLIRIAKFLLLALLMLSATSCGSWDRLKFWNDDEDKLFSGYMETPPSDYLVHIEKLGEAYRQSSGVKLFSLSSDSQKYLKKVYDRVVTNNELLLKHDFSPSFYIISDPTPFIFSLPRAQFYLSTGVINRYLRNEGVLVAALTYEIIKTQHQLYPRKRIVPIGHLQTERILSLTRIPLDVRLEVDRWCFYALERAGYDSYAFMLWIQLQNKNALDFALHYGDARGISREEFMIKNLLVRERNDEVFEEDEQHQSSNGFYLFQQEIRRNGAK